MHRRRNAAVALVLALHVGACASPYGRAGPSVALPTGAPVSECERAGWHELAPATIQTTGANVGLIVTTYDVQVYQGHGIFRLNEKKPEALEDLWPRLAEPELRLRHQEPIDRVDTQARHALYWALGGLVAMSAGIGAAVALQDSSPTAAGVVGLSGLGLGLVGAIGAVVVMPSGREQADADARRKLFFDGEDDLDAAGRGVTRIDEEVRRRCRERR